MSPAYVATVAWTADAEDHRSGRYSRAHKWRFDGGATVRASSAPPVPGSDPAAVDPEEALIASVSSCHMLFFLAIARKRGLTVVRYKDQAEGVMTPNDRGKLFISTVTLRPQATFDGPADPALVAEIHHAAHDECYIAHSIRADVVVHPR
jgi:organic hydroperoxide reductase OsmC/OhrA